MLGRIPNRIVKQNGRDPAKTLARSEVPQVWIAVTIYVLVAIVRKRLSLDASLYETLQILSLTTFETTPLDQLLRLDPQNTILSTEYYFVEYAESIEFVRKLPGQ